MAAFDTKCLDWEKRIVSGQSLVPDFPLNRVEAERALRSFKRLRLPDVIGTPRMEEAAGEWFLRIVEALFGSFDPKTNRRAIREVFLLVSKKNGKALALDTEIATPSGFTPMKDVQPGDMVIGADGKPAKVAWKSPVYVHHDCYEVEFNTGEKVVCDAGHLWVTDSHIDRQKRQTRKSDNRKIPRPSVKTTEEIANSLHQASGKFTINVHRTALCGSLDLPDAVLPIPPYALGAWLGDGTAAQATLTCGAEDVDRMVGTLVANGQPAYVRGLKQDGRSSTISLGIPKTQGVKLPYRFRTEAVRLGLLGNKHIPQIYLRASRAQRLALLQGLMDTDGTISKAGQASFMTTDPQLRDGIRELINSLSLKATVREKRATLYGKDCGPAWDVQFWPFDDVSVFAMPRKAERQRARTGRNSARSKCRQIVAAKRVASVPVQCIGLEGEVKEFLITRSLLPTHNSSCAAAIMVVAMLLNKRPSAEFLFIAPTKKIADIAFKQAAGMIKLDPALKKLLIVTPHLRTIKHRQTEAVLLVQAADTDVITGSKSTGILVDETHEFAKMSKAAHVFTEIRGALAARPDGFMIQITTQSKEPPSGVFKQELQVARDVRDGKVQLPLLPVLYELPDSIAANDGWQDEKNWHIANPNLDRSVDRAFLRDELLKAKRGDVADLALFASQHFNVEIGLALKTDRWVGADYWLANAAPLLTLEEVLALSEVAVVGGDGGGQDDLLAIAVLGRQKDTRTWLLWSHAWCKECVLERRKQIAPKLRDLVAEGSLTILPDDSNDDIVQFCDIVEQVRDADLFPAKQFIGVDPSGITDIIDELERRKFSVEQGHIFGVKQGWTLQNAILTCSRKLGQGELRHGGLELMNWALGNAKVEPIGNAIKITKQSTGPAKIDPLMALLDAVTLMAMNPKAVGKAQSRAWVI